MSVNNSSSGQQCAVDSDNNDIKHFLTKAAQTRTPIVAGFALTHRCSFSCRHCYLGNQKVIRNHKHTELDTLTVLRLLDEMVAAGVMFLTLTGGDPMIREDFSAIYKHAIKSGLLVSVFCNGTLITDQITELFRKYPPRMVEVSIYGVSEDTYDTVTLTRGGFSRFKAGIDRLRQTGTRYRLKTVLMKLNELDFDEMRTFAENRGVDFYHDASVIPCLDNDDNQGTANSAVGVSSLAAPIQYRLAPEMAARQNKVSAEKAASLDTGIKKKNTIRRNDCLFQCAAARYLFHLDPYGWMQPCIVVNQIRSNVCNSSITESWDDICMQLQNLKASAKFPCRDCTHISLCTGCPAVFRLENGDQEKPPEFYCLHAEERSQMVLPSTLN